jgi:hypothetical protein
MSINRRDLLRGNEMAAAVAASGIMPVEAEAQGYIAGTNAAAEKVSS